MPSINKDIVLYLLITLLRIVVHFLEFLAQFGIVCLVGSQCGASLAHIVEHLGDQLHADVAILLSGLRHIHRRETGERVEQTLVAHYLRVHQAQNLAIRNLLAVELAILLRGFMARVGEVEGIVGLL